MSNDTTATRLATKCQRDEATGCLNFTGRPSKGGRPYLWCSKTKKKKLAYRLVWEKEKGPIPAGMKVCHDCDNGLCCEFSHLFLGSQADNLADMRAKGRGSKPPIRYGSAHHSAKLDVERAHQIIADTRPSRIVSKEYGVSYSTVNRVRRGENWTKATREAANVQ
jgi:Autographiviridae endonuclease